ncbi:MAG TPA: hypothetical protein VHB50_05710 [Bryobacteraceae bacterium]|nr:hypothetical protein [Bryobacteraceae bacterium]
MKRKNSGVGGVFLLCAAGFTQLYAQSPSVSPGGVVNAATFANGQAVSPGSLVAIFGSQLAVQTAVAATIPLATMLANVSVTFNGEPAPLSFVSGGQINAQVPWDTLNGTAGMANIVVTNNATSSPPQPVLIGPVGPGVYATTDGHAIAVNATDSTSDRYGKIAAPAGSIQGLTTAPAHVGDVLIVYATGLGPVDSPIATGANSLDKIRNTVNKPTVLIGNVPADLPFSGLSPQFVGVYQLNVVVPQVPSGNAVPIQIQMGGITTPATTNIAVQ